jgi:hypothetical protein
MNSFWFLVIISRVQINALYFVLQRSCKGVHVALMAFSTICLCTLYTEYLRLTPLEEVAAVPAGGPETPDK